jgi:L-serine deaminase
MESGWALRQERRARVKKNAPLSLAHGGCCSLSGVSCLGTRGNPEACTGGVQE